MFNTNCKNCKKKYHGIFCNKKNERICYKCWEKEYKDPEEIKQNKGVCGLCGVYETCTSFEVAHDETRPCCYYCDEKHRNIYKDINHNYIMSNIIEKIKKLKVYKTDKIKKSKLIQFIEKSMDSIIIVRKE